MTIDPAEAVEPTFLLTWNPEKWDWPEREQAIASTEAGDEWHEPWSIGPRRELPDGATVYLLRQGPQPRGIIADGVVVSEQAYEDDHWDGTPGRTAWYVDVAWTTVVEDASLLPVADLTEAIPDVDWSPRAGGMEIPPAAASDLSDIWSDLNPGDGSVRARVWSIWLSKGKQGRENFDFAIETSTWGMRSVPPDGEPAVGDYVLFGRDFSGTNVRTSATAWASQTAHVTLCEVTSDLFSATSPHWADEVATGAVIYPHRFGFVPLGTAKHLTLSKAGPLGECADALRRSAVANRAIETIEDIRDILREIDVATSGRRAKRPDLSSTTVARRSSGQGYAQDKKLRQAVERHAVRLAMAHMEALGYDDVEELGKPYDLVCRRRGEEKHVEVKGTTGAGGTVEYTSNEVDHFRNCPHGADLIVVRDIRVDRTTDPYTTSGGELLHTADYDAPRVDLQPTRYQGRVEGW